MTREDPTPEFTLDEFEAVYPQARGIARRLLHGERTSHTFATGDLADETYLRFFPGDRDKTWPSARAFLGSFAAAARFLLIDHANAKLALKRGGGAGKVSLDDIGGAGAPRQKLDGLNSIAFDDPLGTVRDDPGALLDLLHIMESIASSDLPQPDLTAEIVRLRGVVGLNESETAAVLDENRVKVGRLWRRAKAWMQSRLDDHREP